MVNADKNKKLSFFLNFFKRQLTIIYYIYKYFRVYNIWTHKIYDKNCTKDQRLREENK